MLTKIVEGLIISAIGAMVGAFMALPLLAKDIAQLRKDVDSHYEWATQHVLKRDQDMNASRTEVLTALEKMTMRVEGRLDKLEECIRVRSCTK